MTTDGSARSGSGDLSRSLELLWGTREPATRGPKAELSLERIVDAAVALADREGLGALSMRRVATELGVGTMSLYRHVPGKGELLDLMLDRVGGFDGDGSAFNFSGPAGSDVIEADFEAFYESKGHGHVPSQFTGRSDYAGFIENGIPSGGLFTGAEDLKTAEEAMMFGGTAGEAYDVNYHAPGDTIENLPRGLLGRARPGGVFGV